MARLVTPAAPASAARGKVTIAVVSWNTRELLGRCLDSLTADADAGLADVWVVDNGSSDGSPELVRERYGWVELLVPDENLGFGRGVNLVAEHARGDWIAAANADIEFTPGSLAALVAEGERDRTIGAIAPRLVLPDGSTQHSVHAFPRPSLSLTLALGVPSLSAGLADRLCIEGAWDPDRARDVDWAHGALLLVRRDAFDEIGGFDSEQWMYAEDIDIAWRLADAGYRVRYVPGARVHHEAGAAATQAFGDAGRGHRHIAASYAWMMRRQGPVRTRAAALLAVTGASVRYAAFALLSPLGESWARRREQQGRYIRRHRLGLRSKAKIISAA